MGAAAGRLADGNAPQDVQLSAAVVLNHLRAAREIVGHEVVKDGLDRLSAAQQEELEAAVPAARIRTETFDAAVRAIAGVAKRDVHALLDEIVERGTERLFGTVWRAFLRLATDRMIVARTAVIYARTLSCGTMRSEIARPGHARVQLSGWPDVPKMRLVALTAGIRGVLRVAGRKDVTSRFERSPDGALFIADWAH